MGKCSNKSRLEEKAKFIDIIPFNVLSDDKRRKYIPYCFLKENKSILLDDKFCAGIECEYLQRAYFPGEGSGNCITHDEIIAELEKRLKRLGMTVFKNERYTLKNCKEEMEYFGLYSNDKNGEIDMYAVNDKKEILISIEVKESQCRHNDNKAHKQLRKDFFYLKEKHPGFKINFMYAYGVSKGRRRYNIENYKIESYKIENFKSH